VYRSSRSYGVSDHASWGYTSDDERADVVASWLVDGLRANQRAMYVGAGTREQLAAELQRDEELAVALRAGVLTVFTVTELYDLSLPIDPPRQLAGYDAVVTQAIEDGFDGVRVAADITPLVADPTRRSSHVRWEQIADRYMTERPLAPMCVFDERRLDDVDAIACAHPLRDPSHGTFAIYGLDRITSALVGEVERLATAAFAEVLRGIPPTDTVLDVTRLAFLDGHSAWLLARELEQRRRAGRALEVRGASPAVRRLWIACGLDPAVLGGDSA